MFGAQVSAILFLSAGAAGIPANAHSELLDRYLPGQLSQFSTDELSNMVVKEYDLLIEGFSDLPSGYIPKADLEIHLRHHDMIRELAMRGDMGKSDLIDVVRKIRARRIELSRLIGYTR